jgi:hypothetical protein
MVGPESVSDNVLQRELLKWIAEIRARLAVHDKGVLLGVALSLVPVLPIAAFGLLIGLLNRFLHKAGKLSGYDYELVKKGLVIGVANTVIGLLLMLWVIHLVQSLEVPAALQLVFDQMKELGQRFFRHSKPPGVSV